MGYEIVNRLRQPSVVRVVDTTATINLGSLSANTNTENVYAAIITSVKWSLHPTNGNLKITRDDGNGAVVVANVFQSGFWSHDELCAAANTPRGNIVVAVTGTGTAILAVRKDATYNVDTGIL